MFLAPAPTMSPTPTPTPTLFMSLSMAVALTMSMVLFVFVTLEAVNGAAFVSRTGSPLAEQCGTKGWGAGLRNTSSM